LLARPRFVREEDEVGYLLRALKNTLISQRRTEGRRPVTAELVDEVSAGRGSDDPAETVEIRGVYAAIAELADEFREALVAVDIPRALVPGGCACARRPGRNADEQALSRP
jgi:RNA polymerase sigma-70 factor (ECF subfamily)